MCVRETERRVRGAGGGGLELGLEWGGSWGTTSLFQLIPPGQGSGLQQTAGPQRYRVGQLIFRGCLWSAGTGLDPTFPPSSQ